MKKVLYFDTETTGTDPKESDIIQLSGCIEIDGEVKDEFNLFCQPWDYSTVQQGALDTHGMTLEQIKTFPKPQETYFEFIGILSRYCDKFDRNDKFYPAGYNCRFDIEFLAQWFLKAGDKYMGSWWNWRGIDPLPELYRMDFMGEISLPNYKLETVCEHYGIELIAHDAMSDIMATRELIYKLLFKKELAKFA